MISDAPLQGEWGECGEATVPLPSSSFPSWQPNSILGNDTCKSREYCTSSQTYSYYEDIHPDTDTESEGEEDMSQDT
eukprot:7982809-Prorocentrum_lima.AAC.1